MQITRTSLDTEKGRHPHRHGAAPEGLTVHSAVQRTGARVTWGDHVTDEQHTRRSA